uniref:Uncharacterized protein n=1 Tax=Dunaliella tertiolecta TaxID=3047 RepID=A0A7S3QV71_DUNTE
MRKSATPALRCSTRILKCQHILAYEEAYNQQSGQQGAYARRGKIQMCAAVSALHTHTHTTQEQCPCHGCAARPAPPRTRSSTHMHPAHSQQQQHTHTHPRTRSITHSTSSSHSSARGHCAPRVLSGGKLVVVGE